MPKVDVDRQHPFLRFASILIWVEFDGPIDRVAPVDELAHEIRRLVQANVRGHRRSLATSPPGPCNP